MTSDEVTIPDVRRLYEALASLVDQDLEFRDECIVIRCGSHGSALERVRKARDALAKSRPVEGDVERVVEVWKEETRLDLDEKRNSGLDEFAKGFNYGIREARDLIYRRLPSLLAALPPAGVGEWQPIESAPKDGTRILLATEIGTVIGSWGMGRYLGKTQGYEKAWGSGSSYGWHPTHWQPLPAPPAPTTEQGSTEPTNGDEG